MAALQLSSLPPVLKQYVPHYEPKSDVSPSKTPKTPAKTPKTPAKTPVKTPAKSSERNHKPSDKPSTHHRGDGDKAKRPISPFRPVSRGKTLGEIEKKRQHARKTYEQWQNVQRTLKDEDTDLLKRKITLQLQLFRQQQVLAEYNRREEEEQLRRKRDEQRRQKREIAEALLRTCRESLEIDRRKKFGKKRTNSEDRDSKPQSPILKPKSAERSKSQNGGEVSREKTRDVESDDEGTISAAESPTKHHVTYEGMVAKEPTGLEDTPASTKPGSPITRDHSRVRDYAREYTSVSTLAEMVEEDEEETVQQQVEDEYGDVPWHHVQLYKLYGRSKADSFLYPKIDTEKKKSNKPLDPKFQAEGGGRLSANELWGILRGESQSKLLREDEAIPDELKDTYGCFARESLSKRKPAVRRNFNKPEKEEDEAIDRMQDHSRVIGAQNSRHQLELMYRSSHMNEDRAKVLHFNNPIPDLNNMQGGESVSRYMPSWVDDETDAESELSYMKWIAGTETHNVNKSMGALSLTEQSLSARNKKLAVIAESGDTSREQNNDQPQEQSAEQVSGVVERSASAGRSEWDFLLDARPAQPQSKQPKYIFLTERKARSPGQFSKRCREMLEAKNKPRGYEMAPPGLLHDKANSAMGMLESVPDSHGSFVESASFSLGTDETQRAQSAYTKPPVILWPPLSSNAIEEYKPNKQGPGEGGFKLGKDPTWSTSLPQVSAS